MVAKHTERGASGRRVREPFSFAGTILSFQVAERLPKGEPLIGSGVKTHRHAGMAERMLFVRAALPFASGRVRRYAAAEPRGLTTVP